MLQLGFLSRMASVRVNIRITVSLNVCLNIFVVVTPRVIVIVSAYLLETKPVFYRYQRLGIAQPLHRFPIKSGLRSGFG